MILGVLAVSIVAVGAIAVPIASLDHRAHAASAAAAPPAAAPPDTSPPPVTANEFFPEERDLTDCIGVLERPGCGSESRGGWRQLVVFGVIAVGLVVVFGKITIEVRRRGRAEAEQRTPPS